MKRLVQFAGLLCSAILCSVPAFNQTIKGAVTDSTGSPVAYASVSLKNKPGGTILVYSITDTKGNYRLEAPVDAVPHDLEVEVHCVGYKTQRKAITSLPAIINFIAEVSIEQLPGVIIKNRPSIRTHGDTTNYTVGDFANTQDRVIGDVLKRIPGISVASDGTISYNNKAISGIYIDGDNLLDDKYTIASNTIPNAVVDKIQVIENHQPVKVLQNKVSSNDIMINLTFKDKAKLHVLGEENIGVGLPGNYTAAFNALLLKDQYKGINYLKTNNTGNELQRELGSHNIAAYQERTGDTPPATMLSLGTVNNPDLSGYRYLFNQSRLLNINNLYHLKNDLQLRLNAYYLHDKQLQQYQQFTTFFLPGDTVHYSEQQYNKFYPTLSTTHFTLNQNNPNYYLNDVLSLTANRSARNSNFDMNGTALTQALNDRSLSFSNEFNLVRSLQSGKIMEGYSYISRFSEPEERVIAPGYNEAFFNQTIPYAQLIQKVDLPTWFTNNYLSFKIPGSYLTNSFKAGFSLQSQTLMSSLNAIQFNNSTNPASGNSFNNLKWNKGKFYVENSYDIPAGKLKGNLTLPLVYQKLDYSDRSHTLSKESARFYFNPRLNLYYQTSTESFTSLQYSYKSETGNIEDTYFGDILKDYRTIYANTADLTLRKNQSAAIGFTYRKALKLFFFNINAAYNHIHSNTITSSIITNELQNQSVIPYSNNSTSWTFSSSISKYSFALHSTFGSAFLWQNAHSMQLQNGSLLPFYLTSQRLTLSAETKVNRKLNLSYVLTGINTTNRSSNDIAASRIYQLQQTAAIYYNPASNLQFKLSGEHYYTKRQTIPKLSYFFADASAMYRIKKWNTDVQLEGINLFNIKTYHAPYLSANALTSSSYQIPGRIILLKFLFNL
ncbi:MAG: carboxypeptidase regulatory-like domain-containing protein [Chitinophagaceae bacterium]